MKTQPFQSEISLLLDYAAFDRLREKKLRTPSDYQGLRLLKSQAIRERDLRELYEGRAPYELLQNADDAGATKAVFLLTDEGLAFAHNGNSGHQCLGKKPRRRCENGKGTERALHKRVPRGSGKDGDGWRFIRTGGIKALIFAEIDIGTLAEGFKEG